MCKVIILYFLILVFVSKLIFNECFAETNTDSLKAELSKSSGIKKIDILNLLSELSANSEPGASLEYAHQALFHSENDKYMKGQIDASVNIGNAYSNLGNHKLSIEYYQRALKYYKKEKNKEKIAEILNIIAKSYYHIEKNKNLKYEHSELPLKIREELRFKEGISASLDIHKEIEKSKEKIEKNEYFKNALNYLDRSVKEAKSGDYQELIMKNYQFFSEIFIQQGNFEKGLEFFKMYSEIKDSIYDSEINKKMAEIRIKYETERKEKEIEILKKKDEIQLLQLARQKILLKSFIISSGLFLISIIILLNRYYVKKKSNEKLEAKTNELSLINEKLILSESSLRTANTTKDKFFSIIARDLRTPITEFLGLSKFLTERWCDLSSDETQNCIVDINEYAVNLKNLLENLLLWSRCQLGIAEHYPEKIDLNELISHVIFDYKNIAGGKNIRIISEIEHETYVFADMSDVLIILDQLLSNAIKFNKKEGEINISTQDRGQDIIISIHDNGFGINDNELNNLFKIDLSVNSVSTPKEKGTGLGLIVCKEIVEKNDGKIWADSMIGKGSKFHFSLRKYITEK
jgi:signal transduction histidine kinase